MQGFTHTFNGKQYSVSLRLCPDGFTDGATRAAIINAFGALVTSRDIMGDPRKADLLLDTITIVRDENGAEVPRPWPTWMRDIPDTRLRALTDFFFDDLAKKIDSSSTFETDTSSKEMMSWISIALNRSPGATSQDPTA